MPYKKKATPGSIKFNKLIAELIGKREKIKAQIEFRHDILESQKGVNYQSECDRLQGAQKLSGLDTYVKSRMKCLQSMARKSLKGDGDTYRIYSAKFNSL